MSFLLPGVPGTIKIQGSCHSCQGRDRGKSGKSIYNLVILICPRKSLDTNLRHSQKSLRALFQNAHVKSLGGRLPTENLLTVGILSLNFTSLGDFTAEESYFVDSRFPCLNNWRHLYLKGDN